MWAKYIFGALFGPPDESNILSDLKISIDDSEETGGSFEHRVFKQFFEDEIQASLQIKERWEKRSPPTPLTLSAILAELKSVPHQLDQPKASHHWLARDQDILTVSENAEIFFHTVREFINQRRELIGTMEFDKDDDLCMDFVASAANLRMAVFGIEMQSRFAIKGIAGNIVHAIATTNAIAAGLIVLEALKVCWIKWVQYVMIGA